MDKDSSLFRTFVNYGRRRFYNIGPSPKLGLIVKNLKGSKQTGLLFGSAALSIMTLSKTTINLLTLSINTLLKLGITILNISQNKYTQHNDTQHN